MGTAWKPLGAAPAKKLTTIYFQPYQLAQWLARFARGYLKAVPDDSHTSLRWISENGAMSTDPAETDKGQLAFALYARDLVLSAIMDDVIIDEIAMHGRRDEEAGAWMRKVLTGAGLDTKALDAPSPYTLLATPYAKATRYDAQSEIAGLTEAARYLDNASLLLGEIVAKHSSIKPGPSPVRLWPHHFDIATLIALEEGDFENARAVGAGLAIPDKLHKEYYFYTYPWPRHERKKLPPLRSNCSYQHEGFFGAAQLMSKVIAQSDQEATARSFFDETITLFIDVLKEEAKAR